MTPEYRIEAENHIKEYFKSFEDIKEILNIKCEETFTDLGVIVNVWNVKTENEAFWVVEGEETPMNLYTGSENSDLRNYSRKIVDSTWSYNSMIVHSQNKKYPDAKIALLFTCTTVSLIENLFFKHLGFDQELACSECGSLQFELIEYEKDKIKQVCKKCDNEDLITFAEE